MNPIRSERETIGRNQIEETVPLERSQIKEIVPLVVREKRRDTVLLLLLLLQERLPVQPMVPGNTAMVAGDSFPRSILKRPVGISGIDLRVGIRITNPSPG